MKNTWSSFQTDTYTGNFSYQYKIAVPPGTNKTAPEISIVYGSQGGRAKAGWVGAGWEIPLSYVQRDINYTRRNTADDSFDLFLGGSKHDLVFVESDGRYHTYIETYMRIEKLGGAPNDAGDYWIVKATNGTEYRFGYNADAEAMANVSDGSVTPFVTRWYLDRIRDTNGNCVYFTYTESVSANDKGTTYLSRIEYSNDRKRTVDFVLEDTDRPDYYLTVEQGSEVQEARRLKEIVVRLDGALVRRYALAYVTNEIATRSLLASITQYGSDDTTSLPPVTFQYKAFEKGFGPMIDWNTFGDRLIRKTDKTTNNTVVDTFDATGDGLPDLVGYDTDTPPAHWDVWPGTGSGFAANQKWDVPADWAVRSTILDVDLGASQTVSSPMDLNRDGYPDLLYVNDSDVLQMRIGSANGPAVPNSWTLPGSGNYLRRVKSEGGPSPNVNQDFIDLNGDGLPDYVKSDNVDHAWEIYWNKGDSFSGSYERWGIHYGTPWLEEYDPDANNLQVGHFDVNGDGLVDLIDAGSSSWHVYLNTGSEFMDAGLWPQAYAKYLTDTDADGNVLREFADINGDGLPDIVNPTSSEPHLWEVQYNTGRGFAPITTFAPPAAIANKELYRHVDSDGSLIRDVFDMNGDGVPDIVRKRDTNWEVYPGLGGQADLLEKVTDTLGGTVTIGYTSSYAFKNTRLPYNLWVVTSVTTDNGMAGAHALTGTVTYSYAGGLYDFPTREFRGFAKVTEVKPDGSLVRHTYHQGDYLSDALKGKETWTELRSSVSPLSSTENHWYFHTQTGAILPPYIASMDYSTEYTYDGFLNNPRRTRKTFGYDEYGNLSVEGNDGDLDISGDEFTVNRTYHYNTGTWIVDRIRYQYISSTIDKPRQREQWFSYDGADNNTAPLVGNLTREEAWFPGGNLVTLHEHDAYGNRTRTTDPLGRVTQVEYDSSYHTFPVRTTNAKDQVSLLEPDPATGEPLSQTDPNGFTTSFRYDVFGRKTKEIKPYDSEALPTTSYSYTITGTPPGLVKVSKRETAGEAGTLDSVSAVDGFGSLIQTKSEWRDSGNRIAVDYFYDKAGRLERQTNPYLTEGTDGYSAPLPDVPAVSYQYDGAGRPVIVLNPDDTLRLRIFDHWRVDEIDENARVKSYTFGHDKRLLQVTERNGGEEYTTEYYYDEIRQLTKVVDHPGNVTTIEYDNLGRKSGMVDPDLGSWSYAYDAVGNLVRQTDARGVVTNITYDELNRKTLVDYPNDQDVQFAYDTDGQGGGTVGTLRHVTDAAGTVSYGYDQRLRKTREDRAMDARTWTTRWAYDSLDRPVSQTYPDGQVVEYRYSPQGTLEQIPGIVTSLTYSPAGRPVTKAYANGVVTSYEYDPLSQRLTRLSAPGLQDYRYAYDGVGNITRIADGIAGRTEVFGYDDLDRLTSAADEEYRRSYTYDAVGNMLTVTKDGVPTNFTYSRTGQPQPHAVKRMQRPGPAISQFAIDAGASETGSRTVVLNNSCSGNPTHYMASESDTFADATWQSYTVSPAFQLSGGSGTRTVHFKVKDRDGVESPAVSDSIALVESAAIAVSYFKIDHDQASTGKTTVDLNNACTGSPTEYLASESPTFEGAAWFPYSVAPVFELSAGGGARTVYFKVRDAALVESATVSDSIELAVPSDPVVTSFRLNGGAAVAVSRTVALGNACTGNPTHYMASESPTFDGAAWVTWAAAPSFELSDGDGEKTVHFKVRRGSGRESAPASDTIAVHTPQKAIVTSFTINGGAAVTSSRIVSLGNVCSETPTHYMASEDPHFLDTAWLPYSPSAKFILSRGEGLKTVYFAVWNEYRLESDIASRSISLDELRPQTVVTGHTITSNEIWLSDATYILTGNLDIESGGTLTIQPGAVVDLYPGVGITVQGSLSAMSAGFTNYEAGKLWRGIQFWSGSDASRLENCMIEESDDAWENLYYASWGVEAGVVYIAKASPTVTGCTIVGNPSVMRGILVSGGSPRIEHNEVSHCGKGLHVAWIHHPEPAAPIVSGNTFSTNVTGIEIAGGFGGAYAGNVLLGNRRGISVEYDGGASVEIGQNSYRGNTEADLSASGSIETPAVIIWNEAASTVYRTSGMAVRGTLEIPNGGTMKMDKGSGIQVEGGVLLARDVRFTASEAGQLWRGIQFWPGSDASRLENCVIEESDDAWENLYYASWGVEAGVVYIAQASPTITGCTIVGNPSVMRGILVSGGSPRIENNEVSRCGKGLHVAWIHHPEPAAPIVSGNTFSTNATGIEVASGFGGTYNRNAFVDNSSIAVSYDGESVLEFTECDWGSPSGPHDDSDDRATGGLYNPGGLGGKVSDNVNYFPWVGCTVGATAPPTGLTGSIRDGQTLLTWNANGEPDLGGYKVYYRTATGNWQAPKLPGLATSYALAGLTNGTEYRIALTSMNSLGAESVKSPEISITPDGAAPAGSVVINDNDAWTRSGDVTLTLAATDTNGVPEMCVSNATSCTAWEPFAQTKSWTLNSGDGTRSVYAWFMDGALNVSGPHTASITVDSVAPETVLVATPADPSSSTDATFAFTSDEVNSTFECRLDTAPFDACTTPKMYPSIPRGSHTFEVRATDPAGNTDASPAAYPWTMNGNNPPVLAAPAPPPCVEMQPCTFRLTATDPDGDALSFSALKLPSGARVHPATGVFTWVPGPVQSGSYAVRFVASDGTLSSAKDTTLRVANQVLFFDDFAHGTAAGDAEWRELAGDWSVTGTARGYISALTKPVNLAVAKAITNYSLGSLATRVYLYKPRVGTANAALVFSYRGATLYRYVEVLPGKVAVGQVGTMGGVGALRRVYASTRAKEGAWMDLRLDLAADGRTNVFLGGVRTISYKFPARVPGLVGVRAAAARSLFDNFTVRDQTALP